MSDELEEAPSSRRWLRVLGFLIGGLLLLCVVLYFVVSSNAFLRSVVLPKVGKALNAEVSVADASFSPFSQLTLNRLKVQPNGAEPLLTADQVKVRYSLLSILRGNYVVNELTIVNPTVAVVKLANGASNLDPLTNRPPSQPSASTSSGPLHVAVQNVTVKNATFRLTDHAAGGAVQSTQIGPFELALDRLENGQAGKLTVGTGFHVENQAPAGGKQTNGVLEGKLNGSFSFKLDPSLLPQTLTGSSRAEFTRADGSYAELGGLAATLNTDLTPTELRQLVLAFERTGQALGRIQASGPLDLSRKEGRITLAIQNIDRQVLNLAGASHGWDFGESTLNATNYLDLAKAGDVIGVKGHVAGHQIGLRQNGQATPPLDLDVDYDVSVNRPEQTAVLNKLSLAGLQQQRSLLQASLDKPMTLTWAAKARTPTESQFQLKVDQLNMADWRAMLGTNSPSGRLNVQLAVLAQKDGKQLAVKGQLDLQDLTTELGTNRLQHANATATADATLENLALLRINQLQLDAQQGTAQLIKASASGNLDLAQKDITLQATAEVSLPGVLAVVPISELDAAKGVVRVSASVRQKGIKESLTGNVSLADFTGRYTTYQFTNYQAGLDYNVDVEQPSVQIHSAALTMHKGYNDGGSLTLSGRYDMDKHSGQGDLKLVELNQNALEPFLAPSLGENKLVSISINGGGSATYDPKGSTAVKADLNLTNWVVSNPSKQFTSPNLGVRAKLDGSLHDQTVELKQLLLGLSPTDKAKNELNGTAHLDMAKTNATPSQLDLQSD